MASATRNGKGWLIQFTNADGKRKGFRIGKMTQRDVDEVRRHVEDLVSASISKTAIPQRTAFWLGELGEGLRSKLEQAGLIEQVQQVEEVKPSTLGDFLDRYRDMRTDVKRWTSLNYKTASGRLTEFFGRGRDVRSITPADAKEFDIWLKSKYAASTVARCVKHTRQFFGFAIDKGIIESNPFAKIKAGKQTNSKRQFYIDRPTIDKVLDACPDSEWRLIVALCRFAGIRCPSELVVLRWEDILWDQGKFRIDAPKTGERWSPIHADLRPYLDEQWDRSNGSEWVIEKVRDREKNLRTPFMKIVRRAGLTPWPRLFHNLRASCQTDLCNRFPSHVVCSWLGNSEDVASDHYLQTTDDHFRIASGGDAQSDARFAEFRSDRGVLCRNESRPISTETVVNQGLSREEAGRVGTCRNVGLLPRGFEESSQDIDLKGLVESTSKSDAIELVKMRWDELDEKTKTNIIELLRSGDDVPS